MASPISGTSSGSSSLQACDQENLQTEMRKKKRMLSNRESARRSRMRKQRLLDDLTAQMSNLRGENNQILTNINLVAHLCMNMESENSVLRAQMSELNHRLRALNEMIGCLSLSSSNNGEASAYSGLFEDDHDDCMMVSGGIDDFLNPWSLIHVNQPVMASAHDVFY